MRSAVHNPWYVMLMVLLGLTSQISGCSPQESQRTAACRRLTALSCHELLLGRKAMDCCQSHDVTVMNRMLPNKGCEAAKMLQSSSLWLNPLWWSSVYRKCKAACVDHEYGSGCAESCALLQLM